MQSIYYTIMSFDLKFSKEERRGSDQRWSAVKRQFLEMEEIKTCFCGYGTILVEWKKLMMQEREVIILGEFFERVRDIVRKRGGKK